MNTFEEQIAASESEGPISVLLGNGFSQAWDSSIFNYANLLAQADFGDGDAVIRALFASINTYDFEAVMKELLGADRVLSAYGQNDGLLTRIRADQERLKDALIDAISSSHPDLPSRVADEQYVAVKTFLTRFEQIFTVNYDLLLYWARNKPDLGPRFDSDDGFRQQQTWRSHGTSQNVHFLHGGLHIYEHAADVRKHASTESGRTIIDQVRQNLRAGRFPLFVSEPTSERKKARINRSRYLRLCFDALRNLEGTLFVFGHSMDENDAHIFEQMESSQVSKVFVSIFGDESSPANRRAMANAAALLGRSGRTVGFYRAESAPVWQHLESSLT